MQVIILPNTYQTFTKSKPGQVRVGSNIAQTHYSLFTSIWVYISYLAPTYHFFPYLALFIYMSYIHPTYRYS